VVLERKQRERERERERERKQAGKERWNGVDRPCKIHPLLGK